jgi:hypothetical protein
VVVVVVIELEPPDRLTAELEDLVVVQDLSLLQLVEQEILHQHLHHKEILGVVLLRVFPLAVEVVVLVVREQMPMEQLFLADLDQHPLFLVNR